MQICSTTHQVCDGRGAAGVAADVLVRRRRVVAGRDGEADIVAGGLPPPAGAALAHHALVEVRAVCATKAAGLNSAIAANSLLEVRAVCTVECDRYERCLCRHSVAAPVPAQCKSLPGSKGDVRRLLRKVGMSEAGFVCCTGTGGRAQVAGARASARLALYIRLKGRITSEIGAGSVGALSICRPNATAPALLTSCELGCSVGPFPSPSSPSRGEKPAIQRSMPEQHNARI